MVPRLPAPRCEARSLLGAGLLVPLLCVSACAEAPAPVPKAVTLGGQVEPPPTRMAPLPDPDPLPRRLWVQPGHPAHEVADALLTRSPDDDALLDRLAALPTGVWLGGWTTEPRKEVAALVAASARAHAVPVLVPYNIPERDCGQHSAGGAANAAAYTRWIEQVAAGIGTAEAIVILEPDSLTVTDCLDSDQLDARLALLAATVATFAERPGVRLYLDGGHPGALPDAVIADRLSRAGVAGARGFSLNVSNFESTARNVTYGERVSALLGGKSYVIDTSRNGHGASGEWCNPFGRALGEEPSLSTGLEHGDAFLWVKRPGESDGTCHGGPPAGQFWGGYALELARAAWQPELQTVAEGGR